MHARLLLSLVPLLSVALAGCVVDPQDGGGEVPAASGEQQAHPVVSWTKHACDPSRATRIAQDLPWVAAWQREPDALVAAFAAALGETLPPLDEERSDETWRYYESDDVHFRYSRESEETHELRYATPARWPADGEAATRTELGSFLRAFGVPDDESIVIDEDGIHQTYNGDRIGLVSHVSRGDGSGRMGWWSAFDFRPLYDLEDANVAIPQQTALETAEAYNRCILDQEGKTVAAGYVHQATTLWGMEIRNASLVYQVMLRYDEPPPFGHCGFARIVLVDAETGAVHGWEWPPCD